MTTTNAVWNEGVPEEIYIDPHPNILQTLGDIELAPWQCIAEFADNSIDAFIESRRSNDPVSDPFLNIAISGGNVTVIDNGPGMSFEKLANAVKAGWSGNALYGSLGLYGMGFNIACARLGTSGVIWTTQKGQLAWTGLSINILSLRKSGNYRLAKSDGAILTRGKADPDNSGTEVQISGIKQMWSENFDSTNWIRTNIRMRLEHIYGTMLSDSKVPIGIKIRVNNSNLRGWEHCFWPEDQEVYRPALGMVSPYQVIDKDFGTRYEHAVTREPILNSEDYKNPDTVQVPRRVHGWIGIQRHIEAKSYGIDILRNGRKIETFVKDVFDCPKTGVSEYPIDDPRNIGGRIVGEIHLDHGMVPYNKTNFDRTHTSWTDLLQAINDNEPLTNRVRKGYAGPNESKLGLLHRVFRRNQPNKQYPNWAQWLVIDDNAKARDMAEKFRKGDKDYVSFYHWDKALKEPNEPKKTTPPVLGGDGVDPGPLGPIDGPLGPTDTGTPGENVVVDVERVEEYSYSYTATISSREYTFETYRVVPPSKSTGGPWTSRGTASGIYEITVDTEHPVFNSASFSVRDAVLSEMAFVIADEERAFSAGQETHGKVLSSLRDKYASYDTLDQNQIREDINHALDKITDSFVQQITSESQMSLIGQLPAISQIRINTFFSSNASSPSIGKLLLIEDLAYLLAENAEAVLSLDCFRFEWTPSNLAKNTEILDLYRKKRLEAVAAVLNFLASFLSKINDAGANPVSREERLLARASLNNLFAELV